MQLEKIDTSFNSKLHQELGKFKTKYNLEDLKTKERKTVFLRDGVPEKTQNIFFVIVSLVVLLTIVLGAINANSYVMSMELAAILSLTIILPSIYLLTPFGFNKVFIPFDKKYFANKRKFKTISKATSEYNLNNFAAHQLATKSFEKNGQLFTDIALIEIDRNIETTILKRFNVTNLDDTEIIDFKSDVDNLLSEFNSVVEIKENKIIENNNQLKLKLLNS